MSNLISRQAAIDMIDKYIAGFDAIDANFLDGLKTAKQLIKNLPSAKPEPEHTMEEFMYGQELGDPEDGSL